MPSSASGISAAGGNSREAAIGDRAQHDKRDAAPPRRCARPRSLSRSTASAPVSRPGPALVGRCREHAGGAQHRLLRARRCGARGRRRGWQRAPAARQRRSVANDLGRNDDVARAAAPATSAPAMPKLTRQLGSPDCGPRPMPRCAMRSPAPTIAEKPAASGDLASASRPVVKHRIDRCNPQALAFRPTSLRDIARRQAKDSARAGRQIAEWHPRRVGAASDGDSGPAPRAGNRHGSRDSADRRRAESRPRCTTARPSCRRVSASRSDRRCRAPRPECSTSPAAISASSAQAVCEAVL